MRIVSTAGRRRCVVLRRRFVAGSPKWINENFLYDGSSVRRDVVGGLCRRRRRMPLWMWGQSVRNWFIRIGRPYYTERQRERQTQFEGE